MAIQGYFLFYQDQIFGCIKTTFKHSFREPTYAHEFWLVFVSTYLPSKHLFVQPIILHGAVLNNTMCMCAIYIGLTNNELFLALMLGA